MSSELVVILVIMLGGLAAVYWLLQRQIANHQSGGDLEKLVNQVFGMSAQKFADQSKMMLSGEKDTIHTDLENKQRTIENLVKQLQEDMKVRQQEIRLLEQDRVEKFGQIQSELQQHRKITDQLSISTQQLASVLSNNQMRGGWGERIIEDLLIGNGLVEGVHFSKQLTQVEGGLRPDITLLLPNKRTVPVDVKFPYSAIQKLAVATADVDKQALVRQFSKDVKDKITKVAAYINPAEQTLDYAILFVPNEMVFSYINQKFPELVDEAMAKRVLIVSPFTFLIVARTVMESYRNFMLSDRLREVVGAVDEFTKEWLVFKQRFEKYGGSISRLKTDYDEIAGTRVRQMEKKIDKIGKLQSGEELIAATEIPKLPEEIIPE